MIHRMVAPPLNCLVLLQMFLTLSLYNKQNFISAINGIDLLKILKFLVLYTAVRSKKGSFFTLHTKIMDQNKGKQNRLVMERFKLVSEQ